MNDPTHGVFAELIEANESYASSFGYGHLEARAARGLAVVTCMDSRIEPLKMLGLEPGDAKIMRNGGARVSDDVVRTLELAVERLGVTQIAVVVHTDCAADIGDQEAVLRADIARIHNDPRLPGTLQTIGLRYDVRSGRLEVLVPAR